MADTAGRARSWASSVVRSPTARSTSCSPSAFAAWVRSLRRWRSSSTSAERGRVDQVTQLLLSEQLAQQVAVERERGRAPLGVGRVALVHVGRDVVEQQRGGERRGALGLGLDQRQLARVEPAQQLLEAGQVEHVAQALAVGLEHDRELAVALGDLQQRLRLQPLLPQRRALAGIGAREQQRAGGVLAEAGAVERGRPTARAPPAPPARRAPPAPARRRAARRRRAGGR